MTNIVTWPYFLRRGHSDDPSRGACAMDAVNWLAHGEHGDHPICACPIISEFVIKGNDAMPDDVRQRLLNYLPRIAGSRSPDHEARRLRVLVLGAVRVFAPIALDIAGLPAEAERLRSLPDNCSYEAAEAVVVVARIAAAKRMVAAEREEATARMAVMTGTLAARSAVVARMAVATAAATTMAARVTWAAVTARTARTATTATMAASLAAKSAMEGPIEAWDAYFVVLDQCLAAGPQGEPWSADAVSQGPELYRVSGGLVPV